LDKLKGKFDGNILPVVSWRVAILPFIGQQKLYLEFKLDEPWDSKHNKKLIPKMPKIYAPVRGKAKEPGMTFYQVFSGKEAPFNGTFWRRKLNTFADGLSNTVLVVESGEPVIWTKPQDLPFDDKKPLPKLGGLFPDGFHVAMANGAVRFVPRDTPEKIVRAIITPAGGESVELPGLEVHEVVQGRRRVFPSKYGFQPLNNLREIAQALFAYASKNNELMTAPVFLSPLARQKIGDLLFTSAQLEEMKGKHEGKTLPFLSWRVAILPYLGQKKLYDEFKLDEPWDSEHNKKLIPKMPKVYAPVRGKTE
jgi:hypothetical protein